jgi:hypothetical protein
MHADRQRQKAEDRDEPDREADFSRWPLAPSLSTRTPAAPSVAPTPPREAPAPDVPRPNLDRGATDLPPHAVAVDRYGTWTCEKATCYATGAAFERRGRAAAAIRGVGRPVGGRGGRPLAPGKGSGQDSSAGAPPGASNAQGAPLVIQTNQPWTVVLDPQGYPSAVIVGGPPSRPAHLALFGR